MYLYIPYAPIPPLLSIIPPFLPVREHRGQVQGEVLHDAVFEVALEPRQEEQGQQQRQRRRRVQRAKALHFLLTQERT